MRKKKTISMTVSDDIDVYLSNLSKKLGMNRSAVITMIINQYRQGIDTVNTLNKTLDMLEKQKDGKK